MRYRELIQERGNPGCLPHPSRLFWARPGREWTLPPRPLSPERVWMQWRLCLIRHNRKCAFGFPRLPSCPRKWGSLLLAAVAKTLLGAAVRAQGPSQLVTGLSPWTPAAVPSVWVRDAGKWTSLWFTFSSLLGNTTVLKWQRCLGITGLGRPHHIHSEKSTRPGGSRTFGGGGAPEIRAQKCWVTNRVFSFSPSPLSPPPLSLFYFLIT